MLERETVRRGGRVDFYFDPVCPWTWITSRWLVEVAGRRDLSIFWYPMSLPVLNGGVDKMPERYRDGGGLSVRALRMVAAMQEAGRDELIGDFYTALGTRLHVAGETPSRQLLDAAAREARAGDFLPDADDGRYDRPVAAATRRGQELAGPDIGSPVLVVPGADRGIYGPVVSPAPTGEEALRLWDTLVTLVAMPAFFEIKHGRSAPPETRPATTGAEARADR